MNENEIPTAVEDLKTLLGKKLIIPPYQRPYTWNYENIEKMIEDFKEFLESSKKKYYMGSILLHNKDKEYDIIDGQQRITSLILLAIILEIGDYQKDIKYENLLSKKKIKQNYDYLVKYANDNSLKDIFDKVCFTVIITNNIDDAFTFFDTQNSRGIQPSVLVLLKSFNLRCINSEQKQRECAVGWDNHERHIDYYLAEKSEKLEWLIKIFFYRVRNWRGNQKAEFGSYEKFRDNFTKELRKSNNQEYQLFTNIKNKKIINEDYEIIKKHKNIDWFEFAIRQPIYQGYGFFKFIDYYSNLLDSLMKIQIYTDKDFRSLLKVHRSGSVYMESFLTLVTLIYYDRFGKEDIIEFVKRLNDVLVEIRLTSSRILKQTLEKQFIRCENTYINQNILDFICSAFDTQEILEWLPKIERKPIAELKGVRETFSTKNKAFWGIN